MTPHLDELAKSGIILEQHYSQAVCSPTRGALLTGKKDVGVRSKENLTTNNVLEYDFRIF